MKAANDRDRHLDTTTALDFLEQRLDAGARRQVEDHLGRPCGACRERVRELGEILTTMRADRVGAVPRELRQRALDVFVPTAKPSPVRGLVEAIAELLFDSAVQPLTAAARRSVGEARRLKFRLGTHAVELEVEREGMSTMSVRGRLQATDAQLWSLAVECNREQRTIRPDANGRFVMNGLPLAPVTIQLQGEDERFRLPTIEP